MLDTKIYSNRSSEYVTKDELKEQEQDCPDTASDEERQRYNAVKELVAKDNYINLSLITRNQLHEISDKLKTKESVGKLTHVLDRGFDDESLFDFIDSTLDDRFVIRLKVARVSEELS